MNRHDVTLGADVILREQKLNNQLSAQREAVVSKRIEIQSSELIRWLWKELPVQNWSWRQLERACPPSLPLNQAAFSSSVAVCFRRTFPKLVITVTQTNLAMAACEPRDTPAEAT